ncbi:hypothetical protein BVRB_9g221710 [Beta vulgaris subsp. vulgaris]|nr:hypothetical protein BVRB_9g221710 [Beta vulgaris subsp. vulgaris]
MIMDLNMMMKRGKIAGKALKNLMFHHYNHQTSASRRGEDRPSIHPCDDSPQEYEFSCSETPLHRRYFTNKRKNNRQQEKSPLYIPSPCPNLENIDNVNLEEVSNMLDIMLSNEEADAAADVPAASPLLPGLGFGRSPAVRQLRITDSPYPVQNVDDDKHVDQAAEAFINKFYSQLKKQKY